MNEIAENLLKSMEQMAKKVSPSGASIIECEIYSVVDKTKGIYYASYCGTTYLTIYATNTSIIYSPGEKVFVAIPEGDLSEKKIILGAIAGGGTTSSNSISISVSETEETLKITTL
jgi:hypothetical protein